MASQPHRLCLPSAVLCSLFLLLPGRRHPTLRGAERVVRREHKASGCQNLLKSPLWGLLSLQVQGTLRLSTTDRRESTLQFEKCCPWAAGGAVHTTCVHAAATGPGARTCRTEPGSFCLGVLLLSRAQAWQQRQMFYRGGRKGTEDLTDESRSLLLAFCSHCSLYPRPAEQLHLEN